MELIEVVGEQDIIITLLHQIVQHDAGKLWKPLFFLVIESFKVGAQQRA